jgi:predicted type IV restriction endonuclease
MSSQKSSLESFRETIRAIAKGLNENWNTQNLNEAAVRQVIVLRILQAAGFDIWNPLEVVPEESSSGGGRVDILIRVANKDQFVIELKRLRTPLTDKDKHTTQIITYAYQKGIRWAIVTNGRTWKIFDTDLREIEAREKGVLEIELPNNKVDVFAEDLFDLLVHQVWVDQTFEESLKKVQQKLEKRNKYEQIIREKMPLLESFMEENTIGERTKALKLMAKYGELSEEESEALLSNINASLTRELNLKQEIIQPNFIETPVLKVKSNVQSQEIHAEEIEEYVTHFANKSSDTKVFWLGQKLSSSSSANIYSCLAEVALKRNIQLRLVTDGERRSGKNGKFLRYIQLSNGLYLFMNLSADGIRAHLQELLKDLKIKTNSLKIIYEGQEYLLP